MRGAFEGKRGSQSRSIATVTERCRRLTETTSRYTLSALATMPSRPTRGSAYILRIEQATAIRVPMAGGANPEFQEAQSPLYFNLSYSECLQTVLRHIKAYGS